MPILASPVIGSIIFLEHQIAKKNKFTWFAPAQGWSLRSGSKPSLSVSLGVKLQWWSPYKAAPTSKLKPAHVKGFAIGSASYSSNFQRWLRCRFLEEKWGNGWNLIDVATVLVGFLGKMWTSTLNVKFLRHWSWGWERLKPGDYFLAYTKNTHMNSWMQNIYIYIILIIYIYIIYNYIYIILYIYMYFWRSVMERYTSCSSQIYHFNCYFCSWNCFTKHILLALPGHPPRPRLQGFPSSVHLPELTHGNLGVKEIPTRWCSQTMAYYGWVFIVEYCGLFVVYEFLPV